MSPTLIATVGGLITAFCWGTADWLAAKGAKKLSPMQIDFVIGVIGLPMAAILLLIADVHMPTAGQLLIIASTSVLITGAYLLFVKALSTGAVGIIVPIGNSYPFITVALSAAILSIALTFGQVVAMIGIVLGAALLAYEKNKKEIPLRELHREVALAIGAAILWGIAFFIFNTVVDELSWQMLFITTALFGFACSFLVMFIAYRSKIVRAIKGGFMNKPVLVTGVLGNAGALTFYIGSHAAGSAIIPTVLSAAGPLVASVWGATVDHEKLGPIKRVGAVLIVAGIIILNLA